MNKRTLLILGFLISIAYSSVAQNKQLVLYIQYGTTLIENVEVIPAILKYDKEFAFSFTFDDGLADAYGLAFKVINGGRPASDGITYAGFFSTDGCGNRFPFRAGIAWYTANQDNLDLHNGTPAYISYSEAIEMYHSGWDFLNHSYNHEANSGTIDYQWQLTTNNQSFKSATGFEFNCCVPPSGDKGYIAPAFLENNLACFTSSYGFIGSGTGTDVTVKAPAVNPVYWRNVVSSDDDTPASLKLAIDHWVSTTGPGRQKWWNEFTHRVDYVHTGSSLEFPMFREYFAYLEEKFGSRGKDNGWFAGPAEVFEYLKVRDNISIQIEKIGSVLVVYVDYSQVPENIRNYDISLMVKGTGSIQSISYSGPGNLTHAETTRGHLVNIDLPDSQFSGIKDVETNTQIHLQGYPNPVTGKYFIKIPDDIDRVTVRLTTVSYESIPDPAVVCTPGMIEIDFPSLRYPPGIYFISVFSEDRFIGFTKVLLY